MRTLRRLALAFASALTLALAGAARAGDVTYPQLGTATTVQDTDLIATWRASGPLTKVQASVLDAYLQGKLSPLFLQPANNLSDLANAGTARTNLGLGSAAQASTGTSGTTLCQLNSNCTWTGTEAFNGKVTHGPSTSTGALFNLTPGAAPTSPVNGDLWDTSTGLFVYLNGAAQQIAFTSSNITGNAATASQWQTTRTESLTGDVSGSASVNGAGNWTIGTTLANSGVGAGTYGNSTAVPVFSVDAKGRVTGAFNQAISFPTGVPSGGAAGSLLSNNGGPFWAPAARLEAFSCSNVGCSIGGSTNVSQFNRLSQGAYQIIFANAFSGAGYTFICTAGSSVASDGLICQEQSGAIGTGFIQFFVVNHSGTLVDTAGNINVLVIAN